jgi:hypothetical protein
MSVIQSEEKSALHAKHEQQHQPQKRLESSILRKIVALDVLNEAHPLSSLLLTKPLQISSFHKCSLQVPQ